MLFEYCWARESLGYRRIISVLNTAFGIPTHDELPFDLRRLRQPIHFDCPETADEKAFYTEYLAKDHSILAFKLLALDPGYEHEISWNYE